MSLGLFACGGDKSAQSGTESAGGVDVKTEVAPTTDNAKTIKVATTSDFPPFAFIDEKGVLTGFDIDVINALAKNKGPKTTPNCSKKLIRASMRLPKMVSLTKSPKNG